MHRLGRLALSALLACTPVGLSAQPSDPSAGQIPPDALVPNAQVEAFFQVVASHPLTDELLATMIQRMPGGSAAPMDDVIEPLFARGEQVSGWDATGVDLGAIVARRAGGIDGNMLRGSTQTGPTYAYVGDRPIETLIPREWVLVGQRGGPVVGESINVEISRISPKVILAERVSYRRHGKAACRADVESRLYADPAVSASELDGIAVIITMRQLARADRSRICEVVVEAGPGRYTARLFDADGYRLPALDRDMPAMEIVPFAPPR
jgi:hypothetical protein